MNRILTILAICLMMASCQKNEPAYKAKLDITPEPYDLEFDRYEEVLFNLDTADFQAELMNVQDRYRVFLGGDLNNPDAVQYLKDFATDPFSITLYEKVKVVFSDLKQIEPVVEDVFAHFLKLSCLKRLLLVSQEFTPMSHLFKSSMTSW